MNQLLEIPVFDLTDEAPALAASVAAADRLQELFEEAETHYGRRFITIADHVSRRWIERNTSPYRHEIAMLAEAAPFPGAWFLNVSLEWCCTCGVAVDAESGNVHLLRTLDWPLTGLGRGLIAVLQKGPAGRFLNLTWPGFAGVVTALAKGRFAAALNQAPMPRYGMGLRGDWAIGRVRTWRSREIPPMHLLRQVFERCLTYDDARHALSRTPIAVPAIFSLAGSRPGEGCVIERTTGSAHIHEAPISAANHWRTPELRGHDRGSQSGERAKFMETVLESAPGHDLKWLESPLLNPMTRLAASMNAADGTVVAQGFEADGPATKTLALAL